MVSCQKGPTRHAYAWQVGPFWQDIIWYICLVLSPWQCFMCDTSVNPACCPHNDTDYRHWREDSNYNCLYRPIINYGTFKTTYLWFTWSCVLTMCYILGTISLYVYKCNVWFIQPKGSVSTLHLKLNGVMIFSEEHVSQFCLCMVLVINFFSCKHVCIFNNIHAIEIWVEMTLAWHSDRRIL